MSRRSLGLLAVLAAVAATSLAVPALAAGPAAVTVRVEGDGATLVPRTALTTTATPVSKDGDPSHNCTGTSAAGALEQATGGDWSGPYYSGLGYSVDRIRGELHDFGGDPEYWGLFVDDVLSQTGLCDTELQAGQRVLFAPIPESCPSTLGVLAVSGVPSTVAPGEPFTVTVSRTRNDCDAGFNYTAAREPAAGVAIGGATTAADGTARITLSDRGPAGLRATGASSDVRSATEPTCVTDGSDGACGTAAPLTCATTGDDGLCGTRDRRAPRGKITSIREHQRFARGRGPRTLAGVVAPDPSGIASVRLRLTRTAAHRRCSTFDGASERFVRMARCGAARGRLFRATASEGWSYLLPARLPAGRYVLDVRAADRAGNADTLLQRTRTRVVFTVA
jgi:hypothetical protein